MPKSDTFERLIKASFRDLGVQDKLGFIQWAFNELLKDLAEISNDADQHQNSARAVV